MAANFVVNVVVDVAVATGAPPLSSVIPDRSYLPGVHARYRPDMDDELDDALSERLARAVLLGTDSVAAGGGPFGAVVARRDGSGCVSVAEGTNRVTATNDPTAHAEIVAIRAAGTALGSFDLSGCVLLASCEPCPMCLTAGLWARVDAMWFAASRDDAAAAGFDDLAFYDTLDRPHPRPATRAVDRPGARRVRAAAGGTVRRLARPAQPGGVLTAMGVGEVGPQHPESVTISVTRRALPGREAEMTAWVQAGGRLASGFDGFLGSGHVRPAHDLDEWHMLYRFTDDAALDRWQSSPERSWWLASALGLVSQTRVERRTGIEGWFDDPHSHEVSSPGHAGPPRWKQACVIWLAFFPTNLVAQVALGPLVGNWPVVLRVLVLTLALTPAMTWLVLPVVTRRLQWWLDGSTPPWLRGGDARKGAGRGSGDTGEGGRR